MKGTIEIPGLLRSSRRYLQEAVACEERGESAAALENYERAAKALSFARSIETNPTQAALYGSQIDLYEERAAECRRAQEAGTFGSLYALVSARNGSDDGERASLFGSAAGDSYTTTSKSGGLSPRATAAAAALFTKCLSGGGAKTVAREHGARRTARRARIVRAVGALALASAAIFVGARVLARKRVPDGYKRLVLQTMSANPFVAPSECAVHPSVEQADAAGTEGSALVWRQCASASPEGPKDTPPGGRWTGGDEAHEHVCDFTGTAMVRLVVDDGTIGHVATVVSNGQGVWCSPVGLCPAMYDSFAGVEGIGHCEVLETTPGAPYGTSKEVWLKQRLYHGNVGNIPLHPTPPRDDWGAPCPCCCHDGDTCDWKRTTPQDPLKWCVVDNACPRSTRGDQGHREAARGERVGAWAHCDQPSVFWASNDASRLNLAGVHSAVALHAPVGSFGASQPPVWSRGPEKDYAIAEARERSAALRTPQGDHYIFQTDCPPDGTGTNTHFWRLSLWLALRLNIGVVWNPANFVSENTPQYVSGDKLLHPLSTPPGDVLAAFGFDHVWPSAGMTPAELYMRIAEGSVEAVMMDDFVDAAEPHISQIQLDELAGAIERRITGAATGARPIAVILQQCAPIYISGLTYEWPPMSDWLSAAYEVGRRRLRPQLDIPLALQINGPRRYLIAVHARLGDIDFDQYHASMRKRRSSPTYVEKLLKDILRGNAATQAGFASPLSCDNSVVAVTVQLPATGKPREAMLALPGKFPEGCVELRASHFEVEGPAESVRSLFHDLDLLANADLLLGSPSSLSKFAASLAPPQTIKALPITSGEDPTASLPGLRGIHNVLEVCPGGFVDMASLQWMWKRRGWLQRDLTRRSMACSREKKRMDNDWWKIDIPNDPMLSTRPLRLSRVVLSTRLARSRQSLRTWDAELLVRMGRNQSIGMPELTGFVTSVLCLPDAAIPPDLRARKDVLQNDVVRLLGLGHTTLGTSDEVNGDRMWGDAHAKQTLEKGGSKSLCCLARWMSSDPYIRLRVMLALTSTVDEYHAAEVLYMPGLPTGDELGPLAVNELLALAEIPIEPIRGKGVKVLGELLRWELEWNILKVLAKQIPEIDFDKLQLLWNDFVGAATVLRGAFDLITRRYFAFATAGTKGCALRKTPRAPEMKEIYALAAQRFESQGLLQLPIRAVGRIAKYQGIDVKEPNRQIDAYGERRTEEALWGRWHHGGAEWFSDPVEIKAYGQRGMEQFLRIENERNHIAQQREERRAMRQATRKANRAANGAAAGR